MEEYLLPSARSLHVHMEEQQRSPPDGYPPRTHIHSVGYRMHHDLLVRHQMDEKVGLSLYCLHVMVKHSEKVITQLNLSFLKEINNLCICSCKRVI